MRPLLVSEEEGNDTKSMKVGRITFVFYQADVKLRRRDTSQSLLDPEVSGGMDQRDGEKKRHPAANESRHTRSMELSL